MAHLPLSLPAGCDVVGQMPELMGRVAVAHDVLAVLLPDGEVIDVSWQPSERRFVIRVIADDDWANPVEQVRAMTPAEAVETINEFAENYAEIARLKRDIAADSARGHQQAVANCVRLTGKPTL